VIVKFPTLVKAGDIMNVDGEVNFTNDEAYPNVVDTAILSLSGSVADGKLYVNVDLAKSI
jgi:hypothetical protein